MPHDAKGNRIQVGDRVLLPARVVSVQEGEEFCNAVIEAEHAGLPAGQMSGNFTVNTAQLEKVET